MTPEQRAERLARAAEQLRAATRPGLAAHATEIVLGHLDELQRERDAVEAVTLAACRELAAHRVVTAAARAYRAASRAEQRARGIELDEALAAVTP